MTIHHDSIILSTYFSPKLFLVKKLVMHSLVQMEDNLANFAQLLQDESKTKAYRCAAEARKEAMNMLMWDKKTGKLRSV